MNPAFGWHNKMAVVAEKQPAGTTSRREAAVKRVIAQLTIILNSKIDEMSLYSDDISRLGMLSNKSLRASRLVVDTGIHAMNWTRQQAIDYLAQHTVLDQRIIEGEVDRYIMMPAQATFYMLGKRRKTATSRLALFLLQ